MDWIRACETLLTEDDISLANDAMHSSKGDLRNQYTDILIKRLSEYTGRKYVVPMSHCTDSLFIALKAIGIKSGDEVIVPDLTWVASASVILHIGAKPIFCEVKEESYCIDSKTISSLINEKTKAIIGVDLLGNMIDEEVEEIARSNNIQLIEDAAEGLGAHLLTDKGIRKAGSIGTISCLSFHATKIIHSFQGGALLTDDEEIYCKAKSLAHHGINTAKTGKYYWSDELGYNCSYSDLQAALICGQIQRIDSIVSHRREIYFEYKKRLENVEGIRLMDDLSTKQYQTYWLPTITFEGAFKGKNMKQTCIDKGKEYKLEIRPLFYLLSEMPTFRDLKNKTWPIAKRLSAEGVTLPTGNGFDVEKVSETVDRLAGLLKSCS